MLKLWKALLLGSALTCSVQVEAQRRVAKKPAPAHPASPVSSTSAYASSIAGVTCDNAAARAGSIVPLARVLKPLSDLDTAKGKTEFETKEQFAQRRGDAVARLLGGNNIVAVVPLADHFSYNADTQQARISPARENQDYSDTRESTTISLEVFEEFASLGSYVGSNAYGATARVKAGIFAQYYIDVNVSRHDNSWNSTFSRTVKLTLDPEKARELKEQGQIVLVGRLVAPYISIGSVYERPTFKDPSQTTFKEYHVKADAACMLIVKDGEVVSSVSLL